MLTLTLVASLSAALPVTYPDVDTSSLPAFARAVDERLLSVTFGQLGVTLSSKRRNYTPGLFFAGDDIEELFNTSSEAAGLYQSARSKQTTGIVLYAASLVGMLGAAVAIPFIALGASGALVPVLVVALVAVTLGGVLGVIGAMMIQDAQRQFFEAVRAYNHALLAPGYLQPQQAPMGPPPTPAVQREDAAPSLVLARF